MSESKITHIKLFFFITVLLVFGVVLTLVIGYRTVSNPQELFVSSMVQDDATIAIDRVHQTSTKNGIKEWSLDARSAKLIEKDRQAVFDDVSINIYMENDKLIKLTAHKGYLNTETRDMRVDGDVVADDGELKILTETLQYEHARRVLVTTKPVRVLGSKIQLNANSASYDLASQKTTFDGKIKGTIFDKIDL
jgi:lipopolysaccharide export system protein LptC